MAATESVPSPRSEEPVGGVPVGDAPATAPPTTPTPIASPPRPAWRGWLGFASLATAVLAFVGQAVAISIASSGGYLAGTILAIILIAVTAASFVAGVVAAITGRGRALGVTGAIASLAANPLVSVAVLGALSG
ncbi:hypothetical protein [Marisediminicola sp. LYQ134]|uniref:hypothetical protein n=1 Tax=Marisediminicola sp. LYQ134 TaxID=3391061 RepID=UPI003982ED12